MWMTLRKRCIFALFVHVVVSGHAANSTANTKLPLAGFGQVPQLGDGGFLQLKYAADGTGGGFNIERKPKKKSVKQKFRSRARPGRHGAVSERATKIFRKMIHGLGVQNHPHAELAARGGMTQEEKNQQLAALEDEQAFSCCVNYDKNSGQVMMIAMTPPCQESYKELKVKSKTFVCTMEFLAKTATAANTQSAEELIRTFIDDPTAFKTAEMEKVIEKIEKEAKEQYRLKLVEDTGTDHEVKKIFDSIDTNKNGVLSKQEFDEGFNKAGKAATGHPPGEEKNQGAAADHTSAETKPGAAKAVGSDPPKIGSAAAEQKDQVAAKRQLTCTAEFGTHEKAETKERFEHACACLTGYPATNDPKGWDAYVKLRKFALDKDDYWLKIDYKHLEGFPVTYEGPEGIKECAERRRPTVQVENERIALEKKQEEERKMIENQKEIDRQKEQKRKDDEKQKADARQKKLIEMREFEKQEQEIERKKKAERDEREKRIEAEEDKKSAETGKSEEAGPCKCDEIYQVERSDWLKDLVPKPMTEEAQMDPPELLGDGTGIVKRSCNYKEYNIEKCKPGKGKNNFNTAKMYYKEKAEHPFDEALFLGHCCKGALSCCQSAGYCCKDADKLEEQKRKETSDCCDEKGNCCPAEGTPVKKPFTMEQFYKDSRDAWMKECQEAANSSDCKETANSNEAMLKMCTGTDLSGSDTCRYWKAANTECERQKKEEITECKKHNAKEARKQKCLEIFEKNPKSDGLKRECYAADGTYKEQKGTTGGTFVGWGLYKKNDTLPGWEQAYRFLGTIYGDESAHDD